MNLSAMVARCKTRFRDTGNLTYLDSEWESYINDVYFDVTASRPDWPFLEARTTALVVTSSGEVPLPSDGWRVSAVLDLTNDVPLVQLDGKDEHLHQYPDPGSSLGQPQVYRLRSNTLEVYPRPVTSVTLQVEYYAPPATLTSADEPVFPEQYHRVLVSGALQLAYEDNGNMQQAAMHKNAKEQGIAAMAQDLLGPRASAFPQILDNFFE